MKLLVRGKYILTDAAVQGGGMIEDGAILICGQKIEAVGKFESLHQIYPAAIVFGNGQQLVLPELIDVHSHGRGLTPIQKGVPNDYLENNLFDWSFMPNVEPELIAPLFVQLGIFVMDRF